MPVINLFGPPEPEEQKVVGTADVINYFPKISLDGRVLWEQRPGLTPIRLTEVARLTLTQAILQVLSGQPREDGPYNIIQLVVDILTPAPVSTECPPYSYTWTLSGANPWTATVDGT